MDDHQIKGLFAVDNPKQNYYQKDFLESLCFFIKTAMAREKEKKHLQKLSYVDSLTYAQNLNHFNEYLEKYKCKELHLVGVIYLDLNGLKEINDKLGHLAGGTLIISASYVLQEIFADNLYRIGGDEFMSKNNKLLIRMKELEISIATGCVWKKICSNLNEILQKPIKRCMKIKSAIIP